MVTGKCIIFSAPSGSGKTTIVKHLLSQNFGLEFSISACTRSQRGDEKDGKDYYFLSTETFKAKISQNAFIEWEEVYAGHYYGTLKSEIERIWKSGKHVIFDVDVVGGLNLKKHFGNQALAIFVQPPSVEALRERLLARGTDSLERIEKRLEKANKELLTAAQFDAILVNDDLEKALKKAERLVSKFLEL